MSWAWVWEEGGRDTVDRRHGLVPQAKDEDTDASPLPQVVDLSEVLVQRDDDPLLPFGACDDLLIGQVGRGGPHDVEREGLAKKRSGLRGKIGIKETTCSRRWVERPDLFPIHPRLRVRDGRSDVRLGQLRVRLPNPGEVVAVPEEVENQGDGYTRSLDNRFAREDPRIHNDAVPIIAGLVLHILLI